MSQSQQLNQQPHHTEQQPSTARKNRKRKNRRKRSEGSVSSNMCEPKEFVDAAADSKLSIKKKTLHTSMEQLEVTRKSNTPIASRKAAGSNWEAVAKSNKQGKANTSEEENVAVNGEENSEVPIISKSARRRQKRRAAAQKYVAMDCEMVGVGPNGQDDMLARVSIVSKTGEVLLDKFVKPRQTVTDYRTSISGVRPQDIDNAEEFNSVQEEVVQILQGKILVGHAICKDLAVLYIKHPKSSIRDTSRYKPLCRLVGNGRTPSLKRLTQAILGMEIQTGEHNSIEDARAAMSIYNVLAKDWEAYIRKHQRKDGK